MSRPSSQRAGFTLIELLVVIAVIAILTTISFGLFKAANIGRNKSKSKGEIQAISMASQSYRKAYGEFPCCQTGTDERFRRDLLDQLVGRRLLRFATPGTPPSLLAFDDASLPGGARRQMRSFLSTNDVSTNDDSQISANDWRSGNAACREFVDAWGNPYDYRYRVLTSQARFQEWKSPNFLFVSCSANLIEPTVEGEAPALAEYWDPAPAGGSTMTRSGIVPPSYFDEAGSNGPFRADNIVNWSN
jgi:prepilin-type N-terminal cleavage/methylation domain-containing protein